MKTLKLIALAAFAFLFSQCKTTAPTAPVTTKPSLLEGVLLLDSTQKKFLQFADSTNGNPWKAIMLTTAWVKTQPNVEAAEALDSIYINILLKSGLQTTFSFNQIDANGHSLFKGGGGSGSSKEPVSLSGILSRNTITNKKVLLYLAGFSQFYTASQIQKILDYFTNSGLGLDVTVLKDDQCTYRTIESFKDYGLVIIDTHGGPDVFLTGSSLSVYPNIDLTEDRAEAIILAQQGQDCYDKLLSGMLRYSASVGINIQIPGWQKQVTVGYTIPILITTKYLDALPSMTSTVVFGNMCYSGQSSPVFNNNTPMRTAFLEKSPISYYGYAFDDGTSASVGVPFSNAILDTFVRELVVDTDSTGRAHLQEDGSEFAELRFVGKGFFLKHFGADDYSYAKCGDSILDVRDGQKYATVCIGKQNWMAQNLNYNAPGSILYNDDPANAKIYGRLYNFNTLMQGAPPTSANPSGVQGVCPKGWHVPSQPEFQQLITFLGSANVGGLMKSQSPLWASPNVGATNSSGFSALPGGYMVKDANGNNSYNFLNTHAYIWTASLGAPNYYQIYVLTNTDAILAAPGATDKFSISCRCLKD